MLRQVLLVVALSAISTMSVEGQVGKPDFPKTNTGVLLKGWMDCVNEPIAAKKTEFLTKGFTEKGRAAVARRREFMTGWGTLELVEILEDSEHEIAAVFRTDGGKAINVVITTTDKAPRSIHLVKITQYSEPNSETRTQLSDEEIAHELESFVDSLSAKGKFSGAILIARGEKILLRKAYGLASRRFEVRNNVDTKFNLGSMNKMFTAVSVLQLVQQGKLSLDDRLSDHVDEEWLPREITDKIRISHLLCHTSGLGNYFNDTFANKSREFVRELGDYKPMLAEEKLAFEPGSKWHYSNTGMLILGVVIESVSGQDYFDYVRANVYEKANMRDSDCFDMDKPIPNLAIGYFQDDEDSWTNNLFRHVIRGGPGGGGFSTVGDLHRFSLALQKFELLDAKHTRMLVTPKPNSPGYGYGFEIEKTPSGLVVGHGGGFPGIHSKMDMFLDAGFTGVVLANTDRAASPVVDKVRALISARKK